MGAYANSQHPHRFSAEMIDGEKAKVIAGGHLEVRDGKIYHFDNLSGHYKPHKSSLHSLAFILSNKGVDLSHLDYYQDENFRGAYSTADQLPPYADKIHKSEIGWHSKSINFKPADKLQIQSPRKFGALKSTSKGAAIVGFLSTIISASALIYDSSTGTRSSWN
ncbi:MAG: hypothetical protein HRU09_19160 [Oligoflexales bacterium]|nr:hypothetical protein [Oligoflexales bacterium]